MTNSMQLVEFLVHGQRHALPMEAVIRVTPAVQVTPLPGAPAAVLGAIDVGGQILPVFSLRRHLGLPDRDLQLSDALLIARTNRRSVALLVDEVQDVRTVSAIWDAATISHGLGTVEGLVRLDDGLVLIHDLGRFLSEKDERVLEAAMRHAP